MNPLIHVTRGGKKTLLAITLAGFFSTSMGQLVVKSAKCPDFYVDILNGTVNGLKPNRTQNEIKQQFPCFTSSTEDGSGAQCGGAILYKDKDISFYTQRDYIEVGPRFKGKLSIPLVGAKRGALFHWLGNPKLRDDHWDAFEMSYGVLVLHYDATDKVNLIQFSTNTTETLNLCQ